MKRKFTDNFVMIDVERTAKEALDLISKFSPEYVIIHRPYEDGLIYYAYKSKFFQQAKDNWWANQNVDSIVVGEFLHLHEWQQHDVLKTTINTDDPANDPEIKHISNYTDSDKTTIIFNNGTPIGLLEANLGTDAESQLQEKGISPPAKGVRRSRGRTRGGTDANRNQMRRSRRQSPSNDDNNTRNVKKFASNSPMGVPLLKISVVLSESV